MRRISLMCLMMLVAASASGQMPAVYSEQAEAKFREAVAVYDAGQFADAAIRFDRLLHDYPDGHRVTAATIMKGKALLYSGQNLDAAKTMKGFITQYPRSSYLPDAELALGIVYRRIDRTGEALENFLSAFRRLAPDSPVRLEEAIRNQLDSTVDGHLDLPAVEAIRSRSTDKRERAYFWMKTAEMQSKVENSVAAGIALDSLTAWYPYEPYAHRMAELRGHVASRSAVKIGALLPLMSNGDPSAVKEVGNEVYDGILFAVEESSREGDGRVAVSLETRDTRRDTVQTRTMAEELCDDHGVIGIIGPVFSTEVSSASTIVNGRGVSLISPTANANGLAATGACVFQANPDYDARGRAMARFAVESRGLRTFAVLAPSDAYGRFLAEGFMREAIRLGAKIVASAWYEHGAADLKPQLASIRRAAMLTYGEPMVAFGGRMKPNAILKLANRGISIKRLDSLMRVGATVSAKSLLGESGKAILDSLAIPVVVDETHIDSLEYPVEGVDAFYLPIAKPEEIGVVSSQVTYFNFKSQFLGSGEWNSISELNANRRYTDGVIFDTDTQIDTSGGGYDRFSADFIARFKKRPSRNALFGYDAASLMLDCIRRGATTRESLLRSLSMVKNFQGLHAKIGFAGDRVNSWLTILQFTHDEIRRLSEVYAGVPAEGENIDGGIH